MFGIGVRFVQRSRGETFIQVNRLDLLKTLRVHWSRGIQTNAHWERAFLQQLSRSFILNVSPIFSSHFAIVYHMCNLASLLGLKSISLVTIYEPLDVHPLWSWRTRSSITDQMCVAVPVIACHTGKKHHNLKQEHLSTRSNETNWISGM